MPAIDEVINLSRLLGGASFTIPSGIAYNGFFIDLNTLADTRADGYIFIDYDFAVSFCKYFGLYTIPLAKLAQTKGYNGRLGLPITYIIKPYLCV